MLQTQRDSLQDTTTTPSASPSAAAAAAMYGVSLPSSLSPPPFPRQSHHTQVEPMVCVLYACVRVCVYVCVCVLYACVCV